jgi:Protein of unknown function (DUF3619)
MTNSLQHRSEVLQDRFGLQVAARLSAGTAALPYDVSERLRAAREQAISRRKLVRVQTASAVQTNGGSATLTMGGDDGDSLWNRVASFMPLIALVLGLLLINMVQNENRAREVAEVDSALLTDDLPPAAYADPGFAQFLKAGQDATR